MRVIAGTLRGRAIATPKSDRIRPTLDRVREAMFNILTHGIDEFSIEGTEVLDLFAGTGALGIEALSRGAAFCTFIEQDAAARGLIRQNIEALELSGVTRLYRRDATRPGVALARDRAGLVFLDPPWGKGLAAQALAGLAAGGWLTAGAIAVIEESRMAEFKLPAGFTLLEERRYGDTLITFARHQAAV